MTGVRERERVCARVYVCGKLIEKSERLSEQDYSARNGSSHLF